LEVQGVRRDGEHRQVRDAEMRPVRPAFEDVEIAVQLPAKRRLSGVAVDALRAAVDLDGIKRRPVFL